MSHLKERKQKNCLNCNAQVYGKYCHICGQENLEPYESVWHLVTHFINDITHFDGKFFSTLRLLVFKPGFLSGEYKRGRRNNYLNPVRMYVFTSFIFFFVFFSTVHIDESMFNQRANTTMQQAIAATDSAQYAGITTQLDSLDAPSFKEVSKALNDGRSMSKNDLKFALDTIRNNRKRTYVPSPLQVIQLMDSTRYDHLNNVLLDMDSSTFSKFTKVINKGKAVDRQKFYRYRDSARSGTTSIFGNKYRSRAEYDSLQNLATKKDGWLKKYMIHKVFEVGDKVTNSDGKAMGNIFNILLHYFPQMLFLSLPLFALFLKLIYVRHKDYYTVSHGIYTVHLYIFYFIVLLAMIGLNELADYTQTSWPINVNVLLSILLFFYEYKAMRNYYGQGRAKTIIKFMLAGMGRFTIILILFLFFLLFSFLKV